MRECDCPEFVIRCAHWDGRKLWLVVPEDEPCCVGEGLVGKYAVVDAGLAFACPVSGAPARHILSHLQYYAGDDLIAAEGAFYAASP